jgi:hypothetical protein
MGPAASLRINPSSSGKGVTNVEDGDGGEKVHEIHHRCRAGDGDGEAHKIHWRRGLGLETAAVQKQQAGVTDGRRAGGGVT